MANATELPNPFTPLAFLTPAFAGQFEVSRYFCATTLGAYVWDIGLNLGHDYVLLFKHKVRFPTIAYFLSRAVTFAFICTNFVFQVAPVKNCQALARTSSTCAVLAQLGTRTLFYLRVTAVWHPSKIVYVVFFILLIAVPIASLSATLGFRGAHIGPTMQCITTVVPADIEVDMIMPLIHDTSVFLAINYRVLANTVGSDSSMARLRVFFGGKGFSTLSQALIQSGQHFYLVAVAVNITLLVLVKLPHLPPVYHSMLATPGVALVNAMACLVFRRIKFGLITPDGTSKNPISGLSLDFHVTATSSHSLHPRHTDSDPTKTEFEPNTAFPLEVRVQRETDKFKDGANSGQEVFKSTTLV
ncbi:hypothetical protein C8R45DRAFT_842413 [Mycena sanguinolenta]|nr:hypothetical protein C8R45DRAFT_842413 [Mycena sanguinolenta]